MIRPILTGLLLIWAIHPLVPMAQVYKWVDQNGVTHYGERPPASAAPASKLDIDLQGNGPAVPPPGCYSIQCQYERLRADRLIREEEWRKALAVANPHPPLRCFPKASWYVEERWLSVKGTN
jgi:hypothetical protein